MRSRIIGLDVGGKRIGVAVSDSAGVTAQPFDTIERDEKAVFRVAELVRSLQAEKLVVGLPLNMDGTEGERAEDVRSFAMMVSREVKKPVVFVDERLTTVEAESLTSKGERDRRKRKRASDRVAAAIILKSYLDSTERNKRNFCR